MIPNQWLIKTKIDSDKVNKLISECDYREVDINEYSSVGEHSKQFNLFDTRNGFIILANYVAKTIKKELDFFNLKDYDVSSSWIVEGGDKSYHRLHRHQITSLSETRPEESNIATVIYTDVPEKKEDRGEFYFLLKEDEDIKLTFITPEKGDMIFMPWTVYHGVYPQGPGFRRTVNIDFIKK